MGIGVGEGEGRTKEAARNAIASPLLEGSIEGAQRVILNITGGEDLTLEEVTEAATMIKEAVSDQADIIFGTAIQEGFDKVKLTVIATGFTLTPSEEEQEEEGVDELALVERMRKEEKDDLDIPTFLRRRKRVLEEDY